MALRGAVAAAALRWAVAEVALRGAVAAVTIRWAVAAAVTLHGALGILVPLSNALRFYPLKTRPNPTFNVDRKLGAKTEYLFRKRTIGVYVFVVLPSVRSANFATVIERTQVLRS